MTLTSRSWVVCAIVAAAASLMAAPVRAQNVTTGTLSGVVADQQGAVLPGASVIATHEPTGTKYETVTGADGRYQVPNARVGGPYTVTASLNGFKDKAETNVDVALGEVRAVDFKLQLAALTENVTVTATVSIIDSSRAGTAANVPSQAIETLPTIARSLTDFAKTSPYFNEMNSNGQDSFLSVAGRNNRYNNIQIDGAVNNDLFGLAASGTPGGQGGSQPISLDAIQELQLVVAPYDVRQGGFSGGGINAITKSGSNSFSGTAYIYGRNQDLVGQIPTMTDPNVKTKVGLFTDRQGGISFGGPIARNKAFFFTNLDLARKNTPSGWSINGTTGQPFGHSAEAQRLLTILRGQYGYDPGNVDEVSRRGNSNKVFVRTDFNISSKNQLVVRTNYISPVADFANSSALPSSLIYDFPNNFYAITDKISSTVAQLNSTWTAVFNEFRATYQRERTARDPGQPFPYLQIDLPDGTNFRVGSENSSQANRLNQDIVELTDDLTWLEGTHTITVGTHNEFFKFWNLFIQNLYGNYRFASLDNLAAGVAGSYDHSFSNTSDPNQAAEFPVHQFGFYAGDMWRSKPNFTLTYGVRLDIPVFPETPRANPLAINTYGYRTDIAPAPKMFSPRVGFNWDFSQGSATRKQIRGGIGLFAGRTPYVWLANQYSNSGLDFTRISVSYRATNSVAFVADPFNQPASIPGGIAGNQTINVVDPDYQFPTVLRGNIAYDHELGFWGLIGTGEVLFTNNVKEIKYKNLNYLQTGTGPDGRPTYSKRLASVNDVILLTNTSGEGGQWSVSYKVERPFRSGFYASASYLYGRAKSTMDGTSSVALSNWGNTYIGGDVNNPPLTRSNFDPGSRLNITASVPIRLGKGLRSTASVYYNGQSGQPYTLVYIGDVNGDSRTTNDIIFVPATQDQVIVTNGTWTQLDTYLSNDPFAKDHRGEIPARNSGRAPWSNGLNFRYAVTLPSGGKTKIDLTMDVFNLLNLFGDSNGWVLYPNFQSPSIITAARDTGTGKWSYNLATINGATFSTFTRDDLRSRWQAQWGVRVRF